MLIGTQWKPEVLSLKAARCCQPVNWQYLASWFLFSVELHGSWELEADDSQHTGMPAL